MLEDLQVNGGSFEYSTSSVLSTLDMTKANASKGRRLVMLSTILLQNLR
jgi:predicted NAD/FAD-binding protein